MFTLIATEKIMRLKNIYPSSNMPRVDIHTHMDSKTNYAKAVDSMDQWVRARPR